MSNLAPSWTADRPHLAYAEGWEVVVVNIALAIFFRKIIQELFIRLQAEGTHRQNLGLTSGKQA